MKLILLSLMIGSLMFFNIATALPIVAPGGFNPSQVNIQQQGNNTIVNQSSHITHIYWNKFNIGQGETTTFNQPSKSAVAVNRINAANGASEIYGTLKANGRIVLINQAGLYFAPGSFVDVGSIIASTSDMTKFDEQKYVFDIPSKIPGAAIINRGTIKAADYGLVALIGNRVENSGNITAHAGTVVMGAGNKFTLDFVGDQLLNFSIDEGSSTNTTAQDVKDLGTVHVSPAMTQKILDRTVNTKGIQEATNFAKAENGDLIFSSGKIDVSGRSPGQRGGKVKLLAKRVIIENAEIDASGSASGGEVLIGGNYQGKGPEFNATETYVGKGTNVNVSASHQGNAGKAIVWGNDYTFFDGTILAQGGPLGGNGGFVETSARLLDIGSNAKVSTLAVNGKIGTWLLDPASVTITNGPDVDVTYVGGTYTYNTPDNPTVFINLANLETYLNSSNIIINADAHGTNTAPQIYFGAGISDISWSSGTTLTLQASATDPTYFGTTGIYLTQPLTINGNVGFVGPVYGSGQTLTVNGDASFSSSIGTSSGMLAGLSVSNRLTLGSSAVYINSPISGGTSTIDSNNNTVGPSTFQLGSGGNRITLYKSLNGFTNVAQVVNQSNSFSFYFDRFGSLIGLGSDTLDLGNVNATRISSSTFSINDPILFTVSGGLDIVGIPTTSTSDVFIQGQQQGQDATSRANTSTTTTDSSTISNSITTTQQALDTAFGNTKFSAETPGGGCGGNVSGASTGKI